MDLVDAALAQAVELGEVGVQVAAYVGDDLVLERWVGEARPERPVDGDTLFPVLSVSKAVTATAIHIQAERGLVDYDASIATYWPEFGKHGKGTVTIRHVLSHRSGVAGMPQEATADLMANWDWMIDRLADLEPLSLPGVNNMYAPYSFGWILGEVVRRTDRVHRPFGQFVQEEIFEPLKIRDFWIGLPPAEEHRVATLVGPFEEPKNPIRRKAVPSAVPIGPDLFNNPVIHQACFPSAGGIATARSVARFFALLANKGQLDDVRLLSESRVKALLRERPDTWLRDEMLDAVAVIGEGGFWLAGLDPVVGAAKSNILYHTGGGGTYAWADVDSRLAVAICHNRMFTKAAVQPGATATHPFLALGDAIRRTTASMDISAGLQQSS